MTTRTRFAPSPTGDLHIGGVRTALFSYLYAKRHAGEFVLRIEDTDRARSTDEAVQVILEGMQWVGLKEDEGPFYQSQRFDRYHQAITRLLESGHAYHCYCTPEELKERREAQKARKENTRYDRRCRAADTQPREGIDPVVRFKSPLTGATAFDDSVMGRIVVQNEEMDDLIIARSDGTPTYNLTVVVDDVDMKISHVIRGDDHLNNTPKQINIMRALDFEPPKYAHVPMILGKDGAKLSKRHSAVSVLEYRKQGFLPEALLNYLVRLGWSHGDQEVFSLDDMVGLFDITDVNKSASAFDPEKLTWLNQHYLRESDSAASGAALAEHLQALGVDPNNGPALSSVVELYAERASTLVDLAASAVWLFQDLTEYVPKASKKFLGEGSQAILQTMRASLTSLTGWDETGIDQCVAACMAKHDVKMGSVAQPLRVAATGNSVSPSVGATLVVLGRDRTLQRISRAIDWIAAQSTT
ncbi:MAG: glutamate--tRNA ligase [Gammaproteobacteria bacterium]